MCELNKLEREVLEMLLEGDDAVLMNLRLQLDSVSVIDREITGAGFYTNFSVANTNKFVVPDLTFNFGDVLAKIGSSDHYLGFLLYVEDGIITMLEGYSYDERWPNRGYDYKLYYLNGERDFEKLKLNWN